MGLRVAVKPMFEVPHTPPILVDMPFKQTALEFVVLIRPTKYYLHVFISRRRESWFGNLFNAISVYQVRHYQTPGRYHHIVLILSMCYRCILQVKGVYSCQRLLVSVLTVT